MLGGHPPRFVGRRDALTEVAWAIEEARAGRPALLLIEGERGLGKTRLVDEAKARSSEVTFAAWPMCTGDVLVFEDVDRASDEALAALRAFADEGTPGAVVVTFQPTSEDAAAALLDALHAHPHARSLRLERFSREETEEFATAVAGRPLNALIVEQLFAKTGGHPRLLTELAHALNPYSESDTLVTSPYRPLPETERRRLHGTIDAALLAYVGDADES